MREAGRHWILGGESMRAPPKLILARLIFFAIADFNKKREMELREYDMV